MLANTGCTCTGIIIVLFYQIMCVCYIILFRSGKIPYNFQVPLCPHFVSAEPTTNSRFTDKHIGRYRTWLNTSDLQSSAWWPPLGAYTDSRPHRDLSGVWDGIQPWRHYTARRYLDRRVLSGEKRIHFCNAVHVHVTSLLSRRLQAMCTLHLGDRWGRSCFLMARCCVRSTLVPCHPTHPVKKIYIYKIFIYLFTHPHTHTKTLK